MALRFEKDVLSNWTMEKAKFMRLLLDPESCLLPVELKEAYERAYANLFYKSRKDIIHFSETELTDYINKHLLDQQIRPLGLLIKNDALRETDRAIKKDMLIRAKYLFNLAGSRTHQFVFDDFQHLHDIDQEIKKLEEQI